MSLKHVIKKIMFKQYYSSDSYINYLRNCGAEIGDGTYFYCPENHPVDETAIPFLKMGRNCRITDNVLLLLHDYSYAVMRSTHHAMLLKTGEIIIGDNVFLGTRSIILMNTTIGDNVIIGAGSVVCGQFPSNVVIAGNPAKVICTLDEYYEKCKNRFDSCAKTYYLSKSRALGRSLRENEMGWYVALWRTNDLAERRRYLSSLRVDGDDKKAVVEDVLYWNPTYKSFTDFKESIDNH